MTAGFPDLYSSSKLGLQVDHHFEKGAIKEMAELFLLKMYPFTINITSELQIRAGIDDNSKIIFFISQ